MMVLANAVDVPTEVISFAFCFFSRNFCFPSESVYTVVGNTDEMGALRVGTMECFTFG
jgi:hypothetical protein